MPTPAPASPIPQMVVRPPSVSVPQPAGQPIPTPTSATIPPQLLDELQQLVEGGFPSRPVVVPSGPVPRNITIGTQPPAVEAVPSGQRGAAPRAPRREPTRADVRPELTLRQAMIERLLGRGR